MFLELLNRLPLIDSFGRTVDYVRVSVTDGRAVLAGTDTIAGSTLTQDAALRL